MDDFAYGGLIVVIESAPQGVGHQLFRYGSGKLFRVGKKVVAYKNECPHYGGPVCQGKIFRQTEEELGIDKTSRSMAVSMAFRAPDRTLSSEEVAVTVGQVIARLAQTLGAELRSQQ